MIQYKLIRQSPEGLCVRGKLYKVIRNQECFLCDTLENADYLVPALIYHVSVTKSPKFNRLLPVIEQVPGRSGICIHRGTKPEHSHGCILVTPTMEQELTARLLAEQQSREETRLEICNHTNLNPANR